LADCKPLQNVLLIPPAGGTALYHMLHMTPPAKTLVPIKLPPDVKAFFTDFNQAWFDKDIVKISDFISDSFLSYGRTKDFLLDFFTIHIFYISESKIILTEFEPQGNIASIKGVRNDKYFEIPLPPSSMLIK
jgi:hypothetical protein